MNKCNSLLSSGVNLNDFYIHPPSFPPRPFPIGVPGNEPCWTSRKDFSAECTVQHVRLTGLNAAIVQVVVSYDEGIALKGGDRIAPFSEIHTLFLAKAEDRWLISAQDVVQQFFGVRRKKYPPF